MTATGKSLVSIIPAALTTVFKEFTPKLVGLPENLYTVGVPLTTLTVVIIVPSLFVIWTVAVVVELVESTKTFALLKYCQGAGAM